VEELFCIKALAGMKVGRLLPQNAHFDALEQASFSVMVIGLWTGRWFAAKAIQVAYDSGRNEHGVYGWVDGMDIKERDVRPPQRIGWRRIYRMTTAFLCM
jgi:hypothetical protein